MKDLKVGKNHRRHINTDRGALTDARARAGIKTMKESSDSLLALSKEEEKER